MSGVRDPWLQINEFELHLWCSRDSSGCFVCSLNRVSDEQNRWQTRRLMPHMWPCARLARLHGGALGFGCREGPEKHGQVGDPTRELACSALGVWLVQDWGRQGVLVGSVTYSGEGQSISSMSRGPWTRTRVGDQRKAATDAGDYSLRL